MPSFGDILEQLYCICIFPSFTCNIVFVVICRVYGASSNQSNILVSKRSLSSTSWIEGVCKANCVPEYSIVMCLLYNTWNIRNLTMCVFI